MTLKDIADEAEVRNGCEPGVAWGRTHTFADVPDGMEPAWAMWVLRNMRDVLTPKTAEPFVRAAMREPRFRVRLLCSGHLAVTDARLSDFEAYLLSRPRSLALSLREHFPDTDARVLTVLDRVIEAQRSQTNPGVV